MWRASRDLGDRVAAIPNRERFCYLLRLIEWRSRERQMISEAPCLVFCGSGRVWGSNWGLIFHLTYSKRCSVCDSARLTRKSTYWTRAYSMRQLGYTFLEGKRCEKHQIFKIKMPANSFKTFLSLCASTVQSMCVCVRISSHVKIRRLLKYNMEFWQLNFAGWQQSMIISCSARRVLVS